MGARGAIWAHIQIFDDSLAPVECCVLLRKKKYLAHLTVLPFPSTNVGVRFYIIEPASLIREDDISKYNDR